MFTLVYLKNQFNRPDTLFPFLQTNVGQSPLLRIDCVTPFEGSEQDLIDEVCNYLNSINPNIEVVYNVTQSISTEEKNSKDWVNFMVVQVKILYRK